MAGGANKKDEGKTVVVNQNVFAALGSLGKKNESPPKIKGSSKPERPRSRVFWAPPPLKAKSWADIDDEDDDDDYYYAAAALSQSVRCSSDPTDSESEEEILDDGDGDMDKGHEDGSEATDHLEPQPAVQTPEVPARPKETERQLSKKERKKKELEELDALLVNFGVSQKQPSDIGEDSREAKQNTKDSEPNGEEEGTDNAAGESKSAKKKKKKDKSKGTKGPQDQPSNSDAATNGQTEKAAETKQAKEEEEVTVDIKERLKKLASMKKKKSSKEIDAAARVAAQEAAARTTRLAAAKKKEKNHYNQKPGR